MNENTKDEIVFLHLDDIIPNRFQPREVFDERALKELAVSIKEHGVIQPIIVRNVNGKYEIIAGERRYKASALAGLTKIPAIVRQLDDKESSKVALLENLQRKNLNAIEEARTYQKILELDEMTQEELAKTMGKSQSAVANKIRLLNLPDEIQDAVLKERISERHARALLNVPDAKKQKEYLNKIINERIPVRKLEKMIKDEFEDKTEQQTQNANVVAIPDITVSQSDFVKNDTLAPTAELPKDKENYGKIVIAPPEGEEQTSNKFINYGEIDDDKDKNIGVNIVGNNENEKPIDINDIKENSTDLNKNSQSLGNLDSLLNINPNSNNQQEENDYKFITPAESIVKQDLENQNIKKSEDYFKTPDLIPVNLPSEIQTKDTNTIPLSELTNSSNNQTTSNELINNESIIVEDDDKDYTVQEAVDMTRNLVSKFNNHNLKAEIDEMSFPKSYQIIIKIEKTEEK